ncbi:MAG: hypothetical protein MZV63_52615 [Marinilabiliales bacterium]|nr:hypothetical protein [Marinilabiliales bacterium]
MVRPGKAGVACRFTCSCSSCHLIRTDMTLYFVSDIPGGLGGKDIYRSTRSSHGRLMVTSREPRN